MFFSEFAENLGGPRNSLYLLHEKLKAEGRPIADLVRGNVNEHGIIYPPDKLKEILIEAAEAARVYRPDSFGQHAAREAVARYYGAPNLTAGQIVITPGTSISYWYAFKLLAEPGNQILCPRPSYPLFDYIGRLCGVELTHYRLDEDKEWSIDVDHLESQITSGTRAIVIISPHNPTGMVASKDQLESLARIAARHSLPIISDEVFSEFLFQAPPFPRSSETTAPLVITLNGLSKMYALPGMTIGWMAITGDEALVKRSLDALELISDTFLPVNEIAQFAIPGIFRHGRPFLTNYISWITQCRDNAIAALEGASFHPPAGGFYVTVRIPSDEEQAAALLLEKQGILVHPGYFYDIDPDHLVMTFIEDPATVRYHFERIRALI
jgi:aspartate/methionine/tyrosine aminotransferase